MVKVESVRGVGPNGQQVSSVIVSDIPKADVEAIRDILSRQFNQKVTFETGLKTHAVRLMGVSPAAVASYLSKYYYDNVQQVVYPSGGEPILTGGYSNGKRDGMWTQYYGNGQIPNVDYINTQPDSGIRTYPESGTGLHRMVKGREELWVIILAVLGGLFKKNAFQDP